MYPRASSQFDTEGNVGISMLGRWAASAGEPWLTMASGNGPGPGGRSALVRSVLPLEVASPTISWAAASTVAAGAAFAGSSMIESSGGGVRGPSTEKQGSLDGGAACPPVPPAPISGKRPQL